MKWGHHEWPVCGFPVLVGRLCDHRQPALATANKTFLSARTLAAMTVADEMSVYEVPEPAPEPRQ